MPLTADGFNVSKQLRDNAEARIQGGKPPPAGTWSTGVDALRLLYRLSSNPDTAEDALKLLHELQVHQVELDLQNEAIAAQEQALAEELSLYQDFYDSAPLGYFLVDRECLVMRCNGAATELFGTAVNDLEGCRIDSFLAPPDRPSLLALVQRANGSGARDSCRAALVNAANSQPLLFLASCSANPDHVLLGCCEYPAES